MEGLLSTGPTPSSFFYKVMELVGGGSVINGATPSISTVNQLDIGSF